MKRTSFPFWRFSLRTYRAPGVAEACLALQDSCEADVNLMLYGCWLGVNGRPMDVRAMRRALAAVARWQGEVVRPLRHARRNIKKIPAAAADKGALQLRKRIGAAELDAEYLEQRMLAGLAAALPPSRRRHAPQAAVAANLQSYFDLLGVAIGRRERGHLQTLMRACVPVGVVEGF